MLRQHESGDKWDGVVLYSASHHAELNVWCTSSDSKDVLKLLRCIATCTYTTTFPHTHTNIQYTENVSFRCYVIHEYIYVHKNKTCQCFVIHIQYVHDQYVCILYKGKSIGQCRGDFCWGLWHVVALGTLATDTWLGTVSILTNPLTPRGPLTKLNKTQDDQSKLNQLIYTDPQGTISDDLLTTQVHGKVIQFSD